MSHRWRNQPISELTTAAAEAVATEAENGWASVGKSTRTGCLNAPLINEGSVSSELLGYLF
jgi:hypothetical protein